MVVGTLFLVQKCQTSGCSEIVVYGGGALSSVQKGQICGHSKQLMQYLDSGRSGYSRQWA